MPKRVDIYMVGPAFTDAPLIMAWQFSGRDLAPQAWDAIREHLREHPTHRIKCFRDAPDTPGMFDAAVKRERWRAAADITPPGRT